MIERHRLDTPIDRAIISELPIADLTAFVERIRERRLAAYNIYLAGLEAKKAKEDDKAAASMDKCLDQFIKAYGSSMKALEKLEAKALEIQGLRIALGDYKVG